MLLLGLVGALATTLIVDYLRWWRERESLETHLIAAGPAIPDEGPSIRVQRERTSLHAATVAARALLNGASRLDASGMVPVDERLRMLDEAEELVRGVLRRHPANWEASMLLGTTIYVRRVLTADRRLITEANDWQLPFDHAIAMAPGKVEPRRNLVSFYLETWPYLSAEKQQSARELLTSVFEREPDSLQRLAPSWLQLEGSRDQALDVFPDRPATWRFLRHHLATRREWPAVIRTHRRWLDALEHHLALDLDEAELRIARGDLVGGRKLCLEVLISAPTERRFAPLVERALAVQPPGIQGLGSTAPLQEWLGFVLRHDFLHLSVGPAEVGGEVENTLAASPLLSPRALRRLFDGAGSLDAPMAAHVALLAEDGYTLGRLTDSLPPRATSEWGDFLAAWARRHLSEEEPERSLATLDRASALSGTSLPVLLVRHRALQAIDGVDEAEIARSAEALAEQRRSHWSAFDWQHEGGRSWLRLVPAEPAWGLRIELVEVDPGGDVVDVLWDGERLTSRQVRAGESLEIEVEVDSRLHVLEVRSIRRMPVAPGRLELIR